MLQARYDGGITTAQGPAVPILDDVYRKFGETAEAAQLIETELGNMLLIILAAENSLFSQPDSARAAEILETINRQTLGQLLRKLKMKTEIIADLEELLWKALQERNRLFHSFYRQHNFRRNSDDGRVLMLKDLETLHDTLLAAYKAIMLLSGVDLEAMAMRPVPLPIRHIPI
jgi:hypothetical protein